MKALYLILLAPSLSYAASCDKTEVDSSFSKSKETVIKDDAFLPPLPLFDGGIIICNKSMSFSNTRKNEVTRREEGEVNKIKYRYYLSDGSGVVQGEPKNTLDVLKDEYGSNWDTSCKKDLMNDTHWCMISKKNLSIGVWGDKKYFVSIGQEHYPGSNTMIRIGSGKPYTSAQDAQFTQQQVAAIITDIGQAEEVTIRYTKWPYKSPIDKEISTYGLQEGLVIINKLFDSM